MERKEKVIYRKLEKPKRFVSLVVERNSFYFFFLKKAKREKENSIMPLFLASYSIFPREDKDYYYGTYIPPQRKVSSYVGGLVIGTLVHATWKWKELHESFTSMGCQYVFFLLLPVRVCVCLAA